MMKAPGSLSFSSAMAAGENSRPQSQHGKSRHALRNQHVWVGMGHPGSMASQPGTAMLPSPLHIWMGVSSGSAARQGLISPLPPLPWHGYLRASIPTQPSSEQPSTREQAGTRDQMLGPCPLLVLPSYFSYVSKTPLSSLNSRSGCFAPQTA